MREIFKVPVFQDTEHTRRAIVFRSIIIGFGIIVTIQLIILLIVLPQNYLRWIFTICLIAFSSIGFLFLNNKGFTGIASRVLIVLYTALVFGLSWSAGGVRSAGYQIIPVLILLAGLLKGWRIGLLTGLVISLCGIGLVYAEAAGILPASKVYLNSFTFWLSSLISISLVTFLQYNAVENLNKAIASANQELDLRRKAEKELHSSEAFRKRVFETSMTPIVVMEGTTFKIVDCNPAAISIYGYISREETLGKTPDDVSPPLQYDGQLSSIKSKQYIDEAIRKGEVIFEWLHKRPKGELWDSEVHLISFWSDGQLFLQFTLKDITELEKTAQALKESEERFKTLSSLASEGLMIHTNGIIVDMNQTFANLIGYSAIEDLIGKFAPDIIQFTPESKQMVLDHLHRNSDETFDIELIKSDGTIIQAETRGIEILYRGNKASLVYMRDISDRKKVEKELEKYQNHLEILVKERTEELNSSNEKLYEQSEELMASLNRLQETQIKLVQAEKMASLGVLAAGVAHEINNPLNFIQGGTVVIETYFKEKLPGLYEEVRPVIEGINTGVKRAAVIVRSLNQYSRNDDLPHDICNLHEIIDDCLMILNSQLRNRIEVQKEYSEEHYFIEGNEGKLHQVFLNILLNACQAIDDKGIMIINTKIVNNNIQISITDNGNGVSRGNLKKVFDPFFTTKEPGKGVGLGLSISYNIIQEHNGIIDLESQVGVGTKVTIKLPIKKTA